MRNGDTAVTPGRPGCTANPLDPERQPDPRLYGNHPACGDVAAAHLRGTHAANRSRREASRFDTRTLPEAPSPEGAVTPWSRVLARRHGVLPILWVASPRAAGDQLVQAWAKLACPLPKGRPRPAGRAEDCTPSRGRRSRAGMPFLHSSPAISHSYRDRRAVAGGRCVRGPCRIRDVAVTATADTERQSGQKCRVRRAVGGPLWDYSISGSSTGGTSSEANACPTEMSSVRYDDIDPDTTEIALELARPLDWWKGIQTLNGTNAQIAFTEWREGIRPAPTRYRPVTS
jgi:hypothetical protein